MSDWYRYSDTNQTSITDRAFEVLGVRLAGPGGLVERPYGRLAGLGFA
jgi:hypothetical protein